MTPAGASRMMDSIRFGKCEANDIVIAPPKEKPMIEKLSDAPVQLRGEETKAKTICNVNSLTSCGVDAGESE